MNKVNNLNLCLTPREFFQEKVSDALSDKNLAVNDEIEFYLVNLLCSFIDPNRSGFIDDKNSSILETPLALQLKNALEAPPEQKFKIYKNMADTSLYVAGYFQEYFNQKAYDVEYFVTLGSNAYESIGNILRDRTDKMSETYYSLSSQFNNLVEVFAIISDQLELSDSKNLLATYDRWIHNQDSERLRKKLEDSGIIPVPSNFKLAQ